MTILLIVAAAAAVVSALGVVTLRQTIYCALCLVLNVISLAVIYLLLNAQFLFAVQMIIYAGAVMVLFVFIIALLSPDENDRPQADWRAVVGIGGVLVATAGIFLLAQHYAVDTGANTVHGAVAGATSGGDPFHSFTFTEDAVNARGNVQAVGSQLFTTFLLPFEMTSLLLFVAAIGAVYLTRKHQDR